MEEADRLSTTQPSATTAVPEAISVPGDVESAGTLLVTIASKDRRHGERRIFEEERLMLNECLEKGKENPSFKEFYIEAIHQAVKSSNLEVAQLLLAQDSSFKVLRDDHDVLQFALRQKDRGYSREDELLQQMISLVIKHGAPVNAIASNGDTALFLTCDYGFARAFQSLIEAGADCSTLHQCEPVRRTDSESTSHPIAMSGLNLLQIALNGRLRDEGFGSANSGYGNSYAQTWGPIIQYLCNAGLTTTQNDPALVKFLHVACKSGLRDYVELILRQGVDIHAKAARVDDRDTVYGSALHAAAVGGHKDIVLRLLDYGADPRTARLQEYMNMYASHPDELITPIAAALKTPSYDTSAITHGKLDACEAIFNAGVSNADGRLLLVAAASNGDVGMLKRVLRPGLEIDQIPLCSSIEAITFFLDQGIKIDAKGFQKYAVENGLVDLFKFLHDKFGPQLTVVEELSDSASKSLERGDSTSMAEYLIRDYGHGASTGHCLHSDVATELFQKCRNRLKLGQLQSILEDAVGADCPGVHRGALSTLATELHRWRFDEYNMYGKMTKDRVQLYQLLLRFSDEAESQKAEDISKLWLTPKNMPQYVWDCVNSMPRDEPRRSWRRRFSSESVSVLSSESEVDETALEDHGSENEVTPPCGDSLSKVTAMSRSNSDTAANDNVFLPLQKDICIDVSNNTDEVDHTDSGSLSRYFGHDDEFHHSSRSRTAAVPGSTILLPPFPRNDVQHPLCAKEGPFKYDQLDGTFAMRLLTIEPSTDFEAPLRCHLTTTNLGNHPEYEALSYVWGELPEMVNIALNDIEFAITKNLCSALRRLRYADKERRLWVDAICINQSSIPERNQQVRIMREIYETAQRVVMWVGEEADDSHLIFEHINKWTTYRDDYMAGRTKKNDPWGEAHINMPSYTGDTRAALEAFCSRPYFTRTWVIQEVAVSRQVLVICGRDQAELDLILKGATFKMHNSYDPFDGIDAITHFHELRQISRPRNVPSILQYSRFCSATDPRDKVFGLLGLFHKPLIAVDYASDVQTVFRDFTEAVLKYEQNFKFLHWFGITERQVHGLPSWVPDYTASKPIGVLPRVHGGTHILTAASRSLDRVLPGMQIDGNRLRVKGTHLDTVLHVSTTLSPDPEHHPDSAPFREIMHDWEQTAAKVFTYKRGGKPIAEIFMKTLTAGQKADMLWYSKFGSGVLRDLDNDYFNEYDVLRAWRKEGDTSNDHEEAYLSHFKKMLKDCCYGRKLYVTEKGTMGLAPPNTQEGDFIVFFSGGLYPFILRPLGDETFAMMGDCYLCDPERESDYGDDFDPHIFYEDDVYRDVTEWVIR